jgi:hypothetical protein
MKWQAMVTDNASPATAYPLPRATARHDVPHARGTSHIAQSCPHTPDPRQM